MTFAWYGHLRFKTVPILLVILASWGIAAFEYALQVPANRLGAAVYATPQLKIMQEIITLVVFVVFATFYLGERLAWNHWVGFALMAAAAYFVFGFGRGPAALA
jgi:uncharacterized protein (DUF486 family)